MSIIIRLQNLPWEANSLDIRRYFQGLSIPDGGVHIVGGEKGDAFIAFSSDEDARQAMGRDGGMIKDSRIKLFLSSRNEMQKVIEQARNQTIGLTRNGCYMGDRRVDLMQENLPAHSGVQPPSREAEDLLRSRHGPPGMMPPQVAMNPGRPNDHLQPASQPVLQPSSVRDNEELLRSRHGPMAGIMSSPSATINSGYSDHMQFPPLGSQSGLPPPSVRESEDLSRARHGPPGMMMSVPSAAPGTNDHYQPPQSGLQPPCDYVVYMKGIPYGSCTNADVADFFHGLDCVDIFFEIDPKTGKPAGNAYVEFATKEDFNAALEMNMKHMGKRYIEIFPTNRDDMNEARRIALGGGGGGAVSDRGLPRGEIAPRQTFCVSVTNLPPTVTNRDLTNYFTDLGAQPFAIHIMLKPNGYNAGEAFVEFVTREHQSKAIRRDGSYLGSHRISVNPVTYDVMRRIVGIPPNGPPPGPVGMDPLRPFAPDISDPRMRDGKIGRGRGRTEDFRRREDKMDRRMGAAGGAGVSPNFADPRCVVIVQNIPYRATAEDICVFFSDFDISPDCIMRRVNNKGQVAADCKVAFRSLEDAARAVKLMHKKHLIGRPVFLRLAS